MSKELTIKQIKGYMAFLREQGIGRNQSDRELYKKIVNDTNLTGEMQNYLEEVNIVPPVRGRAEQAKELRRQVFQPTPQEWDNADLAQKAEFLRLNQKISPSDARELVMRNPRRAKSIVMGESGAESFGAGVGDYLASGGRAIASLGDLATGVPFEESFASAEGVLPKSVKGGQRGFVGDLTQSILRDPTTPVAIGAAPFVASGSLPAILGKGAALGAGSNIARSAMTEQELTPLGFGLETALGAGGEVLGKGAQAIARKAVKPFKGLTEDLSNIDYTALEKAGTKEGKAMLSDLAGREDEIGQELVESIYNFDKLMPESDAINEAVKNMPPVDISRATQAMESAKIKNPQTAWQRKANEAIDDEIAEIAPKMSRSEALSMGMPDPSVKKASDVLELRKALDANVNFSDVSKGSEIANRVNQALKKGRSALKDGLVESAELSGNPQYVESMGTLAEKLQTFDKLKRFLGRSREVAEGKAESFISNLNNANKTQRQRTLGQLDELIGSNFSEKARMASQAKSFPVRSYDEGLKTIDIPLATRTQTGRSNLAMALFPFGSPLVATKATIPAIQKIEQGAGLSSLALRNLANQQLIEGQ